MTDRPVLFELDAKKMRELLEELDRRLKVRGVKASLYLVGGAAMTMEYGRDGLTPDIDAVASDRAVFEESRLLAADHGLPETWLNSNAGGWVPPRPEWALRRPIKRGLTVHIAPPEHMLAMKLIAGRRKDRPDIRLLIQRCDMVSATAEDYANLLGEIYSGEDQLAQVLQVGSDPDVVRHEALAIGAWAHAFVADLR